MEYREFQAKNPLLSRYVKAYTSSMGLLEEAGSKLVTRTIPTYLTQLYFEFYGDLSERDSGGGRDRVNKGGYVNCGLGSWMDIYQLESTRKRRAVKNFKVDLYPHAMFEVFALSPGELAGVEYSIADVWGAAEASLLYEEMEAAPHGAAMVEVFERYLLQRLLKGSVQEEKMVPYLLGRHPSLHALSCETGYSERWLQKKYREFFGLSFKQLQSNKRFLQALDVVKRSVDRPELRLTALALDHGYFDQAHFIKEFRRFTGMTPSQFRKSPDLMGVDFFW
ncbi:MAG: AraC family transcriptional regulator [Candidatus Thiodiazotropha sp.]